MGVSGAILLSPAVGIAALFGSVGLLSPAAKAHWSAALRRALLVGEIPVPHLSPAEATRRFQFDTGAIQDGALFILNPCLPDHYLNMALANERLAQEKLGAFVTICSNLGAKSIELLSGEVLEKNVWGRVRVPLDEAAAQINLQVRLDERRSISRSVHAEFDCPTCQPFVSSNVGLWASHDPMLRSLVRARMEQNLRRMKVALEFGDTVTVNAKACAAFEEMNIDVGGRYRSIARSVWHFDVEFWPR